MEKCEKCEKEVKELKNFGATEYDTREHNLCETCGD